MIDFLIDYLFDVKFMTMALAAVAAVATVLTLAMPLLVTDTLVETHAGGRIRAREDPAARARAAGARQQGFAAAIAQAPT